MDEEGHIPWPIGSKHPIYGTVELMGIKDGEGFRMFVDSDKCVTLIPLPVLLYEDL